MVLPTGSTTVDVADLLLWPITMLWSFDTLAYVDDTSAPPGAFNQANQKLRFSFTIAVLGFEWRLSENGPSHVYS